MAGTQPAGPWAGSPRSPPSGPPHSRARSRSGCCVQGLEGLRVLSQRLPVELSLQRLVRRHLGPPGPAAAAEGEAGALDQRASGAAGAQATGATLQQPAVPKAPLLHEVLTIHDADTGAGLATLPATLKALVRIPGAQTAAASAGLPVRVAQVPEESVVILVTLREGRSLMTSGARASVRLVPKAPATLFLPKHKNLLWQ
mmetsp:Transcript_19357/g.58960  ORF Transcript_19357/g.58960 Transcript_19357/m.58960 type:complete len:200 (+) Transcript_19357:47-646(+)